MSTKKNTAAQQMGQLRWKGKTAAEKKAHAKMMLAARWSKPKSETPKE